MSNKTQGGAGKSTSPTIAIIGTEGSGKTVLTAVLARRFGHLDLNRLDAQLVFLNPQNVATMRYVERVWQVLQGGDWPPSTPPGELFELRWKFEVRGEDMECQVRLIDAAGQDLRLLFGEEKIHRMEDLPESLRELAAYCRSADIVLFLVNLKDFEGEGDALRRTDNEAAIKIAMDYLSQVDRRRRFCVVFTQADLYRERARLREGWLALASEIIPYITGAYLQSIRIPMGDRVPVFPVSAVNRTRIAVDDQGVPRRVPDPPFGSDGLEVVVEWMTTQVREIHRLQNPPPIPSVPPKPEGLFERADEWLGQGWRQIAKVAPFVAKIAVGALVLAMIRSCSGGWAPSEPTGPVPVVTEARWQKNPGLFDDTVTSFGTVRNNGKAGKITVTSWVIENGSQADRRSQSFFLKAGESTRFQIELPGIYSVRNPHEVQTVATAE